MAGVPDRKWLGASMCVPVWTPMERWVTSATWPSAMDCTRSTTTPGLSGQCTMPWRMGTVTSIQSLMRPL
jgi:hypothetical protein